jgi:UDPglucose 6-dehydrogenase
VSVYDPQAMPEAKKILKNKNLTFVKDPYEAIRGSDCLCLVTEWQEFSQLDLVRVKKIMKYSEQQ